jgi:hypothetical protein
VSRLRRYPIDVPLVSSCPDESCSVATPDAVSLCPGSQTIGLKVDLITVKAIVNKAGHCACELKNPQGSCCLGNVTAAVRSSFAGTLSLK